MAYKSALKFLVGIGIRIASDKFLRSIAINLLYHLAKQTNNTLDDKIVAAVARALTKGQ